VEVAKVGVRHDDSSRCPSGTKNRDGLVRTRCQSFGRRAAVLAPATLKISRIDRLREQFARQDLAEFGKKPLLGGSPESVEKERWSRSASKAKSVAARAWR